MVVFVWVCEGKYVFFFLSFDKRNKLQLFDNVIDLCVYRCVGGWFGFFFYLEVVVVFYRFVG